MLQLLAVSMGDPAGIGLELAARVWTERNSDIPRFFVLGDPDALERAAMRAGLAKPALNVVESAAQISADPDRLDVLHIPLAKEETPGAPDPANAGATIAAIERGVGAVGGGNEAVAGR